MKPTFFDESANLELLIGVRMYVQHINKIYGICKSISYNKMNVCYTCETKYI